MSTNSRRPVQLQINNSGAWKSIARFDAAEAGALYYARQGVARLALVDPKGAGRWRIATCESLSVVLEYYEPDSGWRGAGA